MSHPAKRRGIDVRYNYDELGRLDTLLKHATMGVQFVTQALEGLREVIGEGVVCSADRGVRVASAKAMITLRDADERHSHPAPTVGKAARRRKGVSAQARSGRPSAPKAAKPHQRARQRGRQAKAK
jgi:hypothetical protein